ncbi:unnamed protein product [Rotaria sp. Silwood1]|nr:unnamed protein product [Rotaria sp. Silwood1]CAF3450170.1 unnamed protein product [Rotaria sp. Silwood1]CAF3483530.1 unnamed protein product [Rotaria sp. Silwood1]CAF4543335.1 unnamed protein product [Rotaria sp. Silwood1]CAF4603380.1 unnamed protein product [Rotaria sp. Silwood1]
MMFPLYVNLAIILWFCTTISNGNIEQTVLRGVQTSLLSMYVPSKPFTCLDGSLTIPFEFVNDDYCDCQDGSDEPGTSACPNGQFFCENKGYFGTLIPSHFVGDGICDCCDGSDEYETTVVCNNTCFELAQKVQAGREAKRALHEAGVAKKKQIIASTIANKSERQKQLDELEKDLKKLENELKEKEELKRQAEILENAAKEKHNKLWEEKRAIQDLISRNNQIREIFADLDTNGDSLVSIAELQKHTELDINQKNEFTTEEVRSILGSDSVDLNEFNISVFDQISNSYQKLPEPTRPTPEPTPLAEPSIDSITTQPSLLETPVDEDDLRTHTRSSYKNEDDSADDYEEDNHRQSSSIATSLEHEKHIHDSVAPEYNDETKRLIQIADQARNEYHEVGEKLLSIKRQIDDLKKQSNIDAGPHDEYAAIIDQCFDFEEREYTYQICMFKTAKQIPKGGGSEVIIGYWDSWCGPKDNKYLKMKYANGATCWNGPARSLVVTLQCGVEQKLSDVREPSRCEYTMTFETPLACDETIATTSIHLDHVEF